MNHPAQPAPTAESLKLCHELYKNGHHYNRNGEYTFYAPDAALILDRHYAALRAENDQMRVALECGQQNCDDTYNDLRAERDSARQAKAVALAECDKLRARCERLEGALREIQDIAENHLAAGVLSLPPQLHVEGLTGGMEKIRDRVKAALAQPEDGK